MRTTFLWTNLLHLWEMDLMQLRQSWERSSKLLKTSIQNLKDLLILEAVLCMSYITVLVKDLIHYVWQRHRSAMLGSSYHLQIQCCKERGLPATASQLRSWYWDLPAAHRSPLVKHWPLPFAVCLNSGTWSVSLSDNTRKLKSINFKRAAALLATGEQNVTRVMLEFLRSTAPSLKSS